MVEIRIVIEGGVLPHVNNAAITSNNDARLREAFHKLLSAVINPEKFNLVVETGGGYKSATKSFKLYALSDGQTSLLIDLDGARNLKDQRLNELQINEYANRVFFMVQEMEAWILSQPAVIETCFDDRYIRRKPTVMLEQSEARLFQVHPEEIVKPADRLNELIQRYYQEMKGDTLRKKKYGKLKDAPLLIENLDIRKLMETFEDVKLLVEHIGRA